MAANFQRMEQRVDIDMQYICASIRYLQTCVDDTYSRNAWLVPLPRGHTQPLPTSGLPFDTWYLLQLLLRHQLLLKIQTFRKSDPFSVDDKKWGRDSIELSWEFLFMYFFCGHVLSVDM